MCISTNNQILLNFFQFLSNVASICYLKGAAVRDVCLKLFYYSLQSRMIYFDFEFFLFWLKIRRAYIIHNEKRQINRNQGLQPNKKRVNGIVKKQYGAIKKPRGHLKAQRA